MKLFLNFFLLSLFFGLSIHNVLAQNAYPVLSDVNVTYNQIDNSFNVEYKVSDSDNTEVNVSLWSSIDKGVQYTPITTNLEGAIGIITNFDVLNTITYTHDGQGIEDLKLRIVATDNEAIDIDAIVQQVDPSSVESYLVSIEGIRHRTAGLEKLQETQQAIMSHYTDNGLENQNFNFMLGSYEAQNITGKREGLSSSQQEYFVGGHYDSVDDSPGADDNASAIAAMMEVSRVLAPYNFEKSIRYVAWDLEESGLLGSIDYLNNSVEEEQQIQAYINFEMIGYFTNEPNTQTLPTGFDFLFPDAYNEIVADEFRGNFLSNVGNQQNSLELMTDFETIASTYVPDLSVISIASPGDGGSVPDLRRSDHAPFWVEGIPAIMLTDGANFRNPYYHTPDDTSDKLDYEFMANTIRATVAYLAEKAVITHSSFEELEIESLVSIQWEDYINFQIHITPNPATDHIIVSAYDLQESVTKLYTIFNSQGAAVLSGTHDFQTKNKLILDTSSFIPGVYVFHIADESGRVSRKKFIIQ